MNLSDSVIVEHLQNEGHIKLAKIGWAYVSLVGGQLWWIDMRNHKQLSVVEAFSDMVSREWEIILPVRSAKGKKVAIEKELH